MVEVVHLSLNSNSPPAVTGMDGTNSMQATLPQIFPGCIVALKHAIALRSFFVAGENSQTSFEMHKFHVGHCALLLSSAN